MLRLELAFYLSCLNLRDRLAGKGEPICFPEPLANGCLTPHLEDRAVGNVLFVRAER